MGLFCLMGFAGSLQGANSLVLPNSQPSVTFVQAAQQEDRDARWLEVGQLIARDLHGGQTHSYRLSIAAGQYARVTVEQKGIDVVVKLFAPDGRLITAVDNPNGNQGTEPVDITAEMAGTYRLEVISFQKDARPGRYEAKLVEIRPATKQDRDRLVARRIFDEAEKLRSQNTRESLEAALKKYEETLALYIGIGDRSEQFTIMIGMGSAYAEMGDMPKALERFDQALQIAKALQDNFRQGRALENTAQVYRELEEMGIALQFGEQALKLYQTTDEKLSQAKTYTFIANIYNILGEEEKARDYYCPLIKLYQELGDKNGEAATLRNLGYSFHLEEKPKQSLEYSSKALAIWQLIGNKQQEAIEQALISTEYARAGNRQSAVEHGAQALLLAQSPGVSKGTIGNVLTNVGVAYYKLGEFEKALAYHDEALRIWEAQGSKRSQAITLKHRATDLRDLGRLSEAQVSIEKSIALLEFLREHAGSPELQSAFTASLFHFYEFQIDLMMRVHAANPQAGHDLAALTFNEKVKGRSLVELLTQARVDLRQGVDETLRARERSANKQITARLDDLAKLLRGKYTEAQKIAAEREIDALEDERRQVQAEIRERSPRYAALTQPQPLSVNEIQQQLLDDNTILLEYALIDEQSYLWLVTPNNVLSYRLPPRAEVEAQARRVYELLIARQPVPELTAGQQRARETAAEAQYATQAAALSQMLLGPAAAQLGAKRLLIVADGALQYLPFAALPAPSAQGADRRTAARPLVLDHEIVNLPSASLLAVLRREFADRQPAARTVAVLADPVFQADDARVKLSLASKSGHGSTPIQKPPPTSINASGPSSSLGRALRSVRGEGRAGLRRLLFSRDEAEAIMSMTPRQSGLEALDFQANRKLVMSDALNQYRFVHFSTHGLLDSRHPELSGLVLSLVDETGQPQEGFLRLHEIYDLRLNADLVVLSACQTGLGKEVKGEGLIGLTRGFMYAGAPRVMASLWEVDDAATAELMKRFYRGVLQEKLPPAAALRAAQIEMLKKRHWQSPYYWGAFVLQGEWR